MTPDLIAGTIDRHMPDYATGKICYIEMPSTDIAASSRFYRDCFGWEVRTRSDGSVAFTDTVGQVSGTWTLGLQPASEPGFVISIMVDDIHKAVASVTEHGGVIVKEIGFQYPELTAHFRDPAGNILGLYQEPTL